MRQFWKTLLAAGLALTLLLAPAARAVTPDQLKGLLREHYLEELPPEAMEAETVEEIIQALGDPYTAYMPPQAYAAYQQLMSDEDAVGIGISGRLTDQGVLIERVWDDTPAQVLGLVPGDIILRVEGGPRKQTADQVLDLLRGREGSRVTFRVRRADGSEVSLTATRSRYVVPATSTMFLDGGATGWISCGNVGKATAGHLTDGLNAGPQVRRWVLDLRQNGGGDLMEAARSAGLFLGKGTFALLRSAGNTVTRYVSDLERLTDRPTIALVGPNTGSAAELLSMAVKDRGGGLVVGGRTYGKGVAQMVFSQTSDPDLFDQGEAVRLTAYQAYGPTGNTPQSIGTVPDLLVPPSCAGEIALLLTADEPEEKAGWLRLYLGGWMWYVDLTRAGEDGPYLGMLLSALAPDVPLELGETEGWRHTTPDEVARLTGASDYQPRRFTDVASSACQREADTLCTFGMLSGMGDGTFQPDSPLTRAQLCALLVQALNLPVAKEAGFADVSPSMWYYPYVNAAFGAGYVVGMGEDRFAPDDLVNHEQLITILGRMSAGLNLVQHLSSLEDPDLSGIPGAYSDWSRPWAWLLTQSRRSLAGGYLSMVYDDLENIPPQSPATRGETARLLYGVLTGLGIISY